MGERGGGGGERGGGVVAQRFFFDYFPFFTLLFMSIAVTLLFSVTSLICFNLNYIT